MIRPATLADREQVLALLDDPRALDTPEHRIVFEDTGRGLAIWRGADARGIGTLAAVLTKEPDELLVWQLARTAAAEALKDGITKGRILFTDRRLADLVSRTFGVTPLPEGRNTETDGPGHWELYVDLHDAIARLDTVIAGLSLGT